MQLLTTKQLILASRLDRGTGSRSIYAVHVTESPAVFGTQHSPIKNGTMHTQHSHLVRSILRTILAVQSHSVTSTLRTIVALQYLSWVLRTGAGAAPLCPHSSTEH